MNDPNVSAILARHNLSTAKSLGQNFLRDGAVLQSIADAACPAGKLVEIGDVVTKTTNGILVLPRTLPLIQKKLSKTTIDVRRAMASCCQCNYCTSLCPRNLLGHPIDPGAFMLKAAHGSAGDAAPYLNAAYCCGCGLCELFSCTQNLNPRSLLQATKASLAKEGIKPNPPATKEVHPHRSLRLIPLSRLRARLGLDAYNMSAPVDEKTVKAKRLKLELSQHIGAPAVPCVKKGDKVEAGQMIATPVENALSVAIHSPAAGTVSEVGKTRIIITT